VTARKGVPRPAALMEILDVVLAFAARSQMLQS